MDRLAELGIEIERLQKPKIKILVEQRRARAIRNWARLTALQNQRRANYLMEAGRAEEKDATASA